VLGALQQRPRSVTGILPWSTPSIQVRSYSSAGASQCSCGPTPWWGGWSASRGSWPGRLSRATRNPRCRDREGGTARSGHRRLSRLWMTSASQEGGAASASRQPGSSVPYGMGAAACTDGNRGRGRPPRRGDSVVRGGGPSSRTGPEPGRWSSPSRSGAGGRPRAGA
jgi:hypothetical protein